MNTATLITLIAAACFAVAFVIIYRKGLPR